MDGARVTSRKRSAPPRAVTALTARASPSRATVPPLLLAWYDAARRDLPWRYAPGATADPYRVWLSEIMLQQTVVKAVVPYFETFTQRWPTVSDLAAADLDDVLAAWAGLGYYSRARNLHATAIMIARDHHGRFPADEQSLRTLPGIGPYTAAAIAAIGFGLTATPVDGNVERVVARLFAIEDELPSAKPLLKRHAEQLTPRHRAGDYAQATMDLGATICTPTSPSCPICPLTALCRARADGIAASLPRKTAKAARPTRYGTAFVVTRADGHVLLRKRPPTGLLGGLYDVPSTDWAETVPGDNAVAAARPVSASFTPCAASVVHVFTHFRLELSVEVATTRATNVSPPLVWAPLDALKTFALPTVALKVLAAAGVTRLHTRGKQRARHT
jgi:A/G-specific adenine glycosylase